MKMWGFSFGKATETGSREVSAQDRQLIDDAIRAGMVKYIPVHTSGLPEYRWDAAKKQIIAVDGPTAKDVQRRSVEASIRSRNLKANSRYGAVMALFDAGQSYADIAAERGETIAAIKAVVRKVRQRRRDAGLEVRTARDEARERYAHISALRDAGKTVAEIADMTGRTATQIRSIFGEMKRTALRSKK